MDTGGIETQSDGIFESNDASRRASRRGVPTQLIILALVAVLVIPGTLFAGFLLMRYAQSERTRHELEAVDVARAASVALDHHLNGLQTTLQTLSLSTLLASGDLEAFYKQAARVRSFIGVNIGLRHTDGRQVINTRLPWGAPLPTTPFIGDAQAIASGQPTLTDVFIGTNGNRAPLVAIVLPVTVAGDPNYLLHVSSETTYFYDVIKAVVPPNWLIGVADRAGTYVTRSENHNEFSGKPGVPTFLAMAKAPEGVFRGESAFGDKVMVGYTHTAANWLIAASIKEEVLDAPVRDALLVLAAFGLGTLLVTSIIALWLWRFIARPLEGLTRASRTIGSGTGAVLVQTSLREFIVLRDALSAAGEHVRTNQERLAAAVADRTRELAHSNDELIGQMAARERAEGQLRQMHKMEAVGQLTGGIAHDFNNMLAIIISSLSLLQRRLDRGETNFQRFVDSAMEGANRAAGLTKRLLAFSRQQPLAPETLDPNRLVAGMSELLQRTLGESIQIETVLAAGLWKTHTDAPQLENAILNLAVNARDAMADGGRLTVETANTFLDDDYATTHSGVASGQYVQIAVSDTGIGMPDDVIGRAFDPFFTTKKTGMGTGLGLSQVYGFVKQSNGHINIYSELGHGTTVKIYLPRHIGEDHETRTISREVRPLLTGAAHEVVLVVEDDDRLRQLTADTLSELGYTVHATGRAADALQLIDSHPEIKLLFTDIVMPEVNGRKLADEALRRRPELLVLYTTGFTRNAVVHNGILDVGTNFIAKPYVMEDLAAKLRQVLSGTEA